MSKPDIFTLLRTGHFHFALTNQKKLDRERLNGYKKKKEVTMLWTILVILFVLWLVGLITAHTFGGLIHILLVIAVIVLVVRLLQGRRVL